MPYPINYPKEFVDLVNSTSDFIGFGNPEAKILIIDNSCINYSIGNNHNEWVQNIKANNFAPDNLEYHLPFDNNGLPVTGATNLNNSRKIDWNKFFNPLWPYMALSCDAKIPEWNFYQKLLYEDKIPDGLCYCFWKDVFLTNCNNKFLSHKFFKRFKFVLVLCNGSGNLTDSELGDIFPCGEAHNNQNNNLQPESDNCPQNNDESPLTQTIIQLPSIPEKFNKEDKLSPLTEGIKYGKIKLVDL